MLALLSGPEFKLNFLQRERNVGLLAKPNKAALKKVRSTNGNEDRGSLATSVDWVLSRGLDGELVGNIGRCAAHIRDRKDAGNDVSDFFLWDSATR